MGEAADNKRRRHDRPAKPEADESYPRIPDTALELPGQFKANHPQIKVNCVLVDALYGTKSFMDEASEIFGGLQVISQIKENRNVLFRNGKIQVKKYFASRPGVEQEVRIPGGEAAKVVVGSARLHVLSHGRKRFAVALKYEGEEDYRYMVATDLTWRTLDLVEAYSLRRLIEVVFEDWKANEGWNRLTKHLGEDGSRMGVIPSLPSDHCLFLHPDRQAFLDGNLSACTAGSPKRRIRMEGLLQFIREIVDHEEPGKKLDALEETLKSEVFVLSPSSKQMSGRRLGRLEPTASLKYKKTA